MMQCLLPLLSLLLLAAPPAAPLRLTGTWRSDTFFLFLSKFGFQRTRLPNLRDSEGHIFGNVTAVSPSGGGGGEEPRALLTVLDRTFFLDFYTNRSWPARDAACRRMFAGLARVAYDARCFDDGEEDFLRRVPCPRGQLCPDEDAPENVVTGHQFTYSIQDVHQARFWYISLVACHRDPVTCEWRHTRQPITVQYDIWLVNGDPRKRAQNPLEYQFSFDEQDTVEVHLAFLGLYTLLAPFQLYASLRQRHSLTRLFTGALITGLAGWLLRAAHSVKMALDGVGWRPVSIIGDCLNMAAQLLLMLVLMLLAQGWTVRDPLISGNRRLLAIWGVYGVISVLLYVWNLTEVDVIYDIDEYQTWPGWLALSLRLAIMCWFVWELRDTVAAQREPDPTRLQFLLHFGAASLLWFLYLPVVALIALTISALYRHKLLLALTGSADFLAFAIMTQLLWPARSRSYFQLDTPELDVSDELEEFSQATHVLLSEAGRATSPDRTLDHTQDQTGDQTGDKTGDQAGDKKGDQAGDKKGDQAGDKRGDQTGDQAGDQRGDQVRAAGPPPWPLPDVTRGAASGPGRQPADSSVFSPVDADTVRLLPEPAFKAASRR